MRGDSLRDLYAKVLAILGLGALAGVGALVDYWPVGVSTPPIVALGTGVPATPAPTRAAEIPMPTIQVAAVRRVSAPLPTAVRPLPSAPAVVAATGSLGELLPLATLPAFDAPPVPMASAVVAPAEPVELTPPPIPTETFLPSAAVPRLAVAADDSGFLMDTLRKTGAGIVRTGAATGATIADAFRGVMGAFKKVRPFKDRGFGTN